ncbi:MULTISPECIES: PIG-L family deacetylase [unclassified Streptomyces]|uniref:PIG-L family deacetylase n=1 Tax=unclassified Streptomyces TaxID=2593676 RepID=UPI0033CDD3D9
MAGTVAVAAAGCVPGRRNASDPDGRGGASPRGTSPTGGPRGTATVLQIVAHPDDDLYFMNPDLEQSLTAGDRLVSVYLNCGEKDGINKVPGRGPAPRPDEPGYAGARRQGLRQAYAYMVTGRPDAPWRTGPLALPGGLAAELDTLEGHDHVQLVFLGIQQYGPDWVLPRLWADPAAVTRTRVSTGSPVARSYAVTRTGLVDALVHLLDRYAPTVVRTMDPDPDRQPHDAPGGGGKNGGGGDNGGRGNGGGGAPGRRDRDRANRPHHDQPGYSDHPDHTATALFTFAALERHRRGRTAPPVAVVPYRGYYNERWPQNLPKQLVRRKAHILNVYGGSPGSCGFAAGCGDYDVGHDNSLGTGWVQRTSPRQPFAAPRVVPDAAGRLHAFGVLSGQAVMWQETTRGSGTWGAPIRVGGDGIAPGLTALLDAQGCWHLFAARITGLGPHPRDNRRDLAHTRQTRPGGAFGAWTSLGTPDRDPERGRRVGTPAVARAGDGTLHLFARNWERGIATRVQHPDGSWTRWTPLGTTAPVPPLQDGVAAVTDTGGRVHVFATGRDAVHHWTQQAPGGAFTELPTGLPASADPPTALPRPDGSVLLALREPVTARPLLHRLTPDGTWRPEPSSALPGRGYGAFALLAVGGGVLLAGRNNAGTVSWARLDDGPANPHWSTLPSRTVTGPSLALTPDGRPLLTTLAPDATLRSVTVPMTVRVTDGPAEG